MVFIFYSIITIQYLTDPCIPKPLSFPHGEMKCTGNGLTETCKFKCDPDYDMVGEDYVTCTLVNKKFRASSEIPYCQAHLTSEYDKHLNKVCTLLVTSFRVFHIVLISKSKAPGSSY